MAKSFYIATRKDREAEANEIAKALGAAGWKRTLIWSSREEDVAEDYATLAQQELNAIRDADALIVMLPGGFGTHVEIGAALALRKPIILHSPDEKTLNSPYPCPFHYHPGVKLLISKIVDVNENVSNLS